MLSLDAELRALKRRGQLAEAEQLLERAIAAKPMSARHVEALAIVQRRRGRWKRELGTLGRYVAHAGEGMTTGLQFRLDRLIPRIVSRD